MPAIAKPPRASPSPPWPAILPAGPKAAPATSAIREGRSFLKDRIGQKLFGDNITIHDDACHPLQSGAPFDGEGVPRRRLTLVDGGVVRDIAYCRHAAALAGAAPTGHGFPLPNEYGE